MRTVPIAKALLVDEGGNMLILRRSDTHPTRALMRDLPGGMVDDGEDFGQALIREIKEEVGMDVMMENLQAVYAGSEIHDGENRVRLFYICRLAGEKPETAISWEHESAEWLPLGDLATIADEFHSFYGEALRFVNDQRLVG